MSGGRATELSGAPTAPRSRCRLGNASQPSPPPPTRGSHSVTNAHCPIPCHSEVIPNLPDHAKALRAANPPQATTAGIAPFIETVTCAPQLSVIVTADAVEDSSHFGSF